MSAKKKSFFIQTLDYLAVIRPTLLFPVWTLLLLGHYRSADLSGAWSSNPRLLNFAIVLTPCLEITETILLFSMLMGAVYIVNQIADAPTDNLNDKLYLVAQGYVDVKSLIIEAALLTIGSIILSSYWFRNVRFYLPLIITSIILGWIYSVPPVRLKSRPILDLLANSIGYGTIAFSLGWISVANPSLRSRTCFSIQTLSNSLPYLLCVGATFINTTLPDIKGDQANNDITTGVFLGAKRASVLSVIFLIFAILSSIFSGDWVALIAVSISLPFFVYAAARPKINVILLTNKVGILILSLVTCVLIPSYFLLLVGTTIAVKLYYLVRFGVKYPF